MYDSVVVHREVVVVVKYFQVAVSRHSRERTSQRNWNIRYHSVKNENKGQAPRASSCTDRVIGRMLFATRINRTVRTS